MSKHLIFGGGIAGMACAIQLKKAGFEVKVFEKTKPSNKEGHAFILLPNGLKSLKKVGVLDQVFAQSHRIESFHSRNVKGDHRFVQSVPNAIGIRRKTLMDILTEKLSENCIEYGKSLNHLEFSADGMAKAACFSDGSIEEGDVFIGADGVWSKTRNTIQSNYQFSQVRIRELVSIVRSPELVQRWSNTFLKTQCGDGGLAVGMLPCDEEHLVWYIQFDSQHPHLIGMSLSEQKNHLMEKIYHWDDPIPQLFEQTDFKQSYLWHTTDMDTLEKFHHKNIALIGDAAHIFLTLTSQGASAALEDAVCLSDLLVHNRFVVNIEATLKQYSYMRRNIIDEYLHAGRKLKQRFLSPLQINDEAYMPLVITE